MYAVIRQWQIDEKRSDEATEKVQTGLVPDLRKIEGFMAYYLLEVENDRAATVSLFQDRKGIEESTKLARSFAERELKGMITGPPEVLEGEVRVHEVTPEAGRTRIAPT